MGAEILNHDAGEMTMKVSGTLLFTVKGLRRFAIEYFDPAQLTAARAWLATG